MPPAYAARDALPASCLADGASPRSSLRVLLAALLLAILLLGEALGGAGTSPLTRDHGGPAIDEASQLRQGALREASRLLAVANGPTQARSGWNPLGDALPVTHAPLTLRPMQAAAVPSAREVALAAAAPKPYQARGPPAPL